MHRCRHSPVIVGVVFSAFVLSPSLAAAGEPARPNILFILADDHAAQAVSAYGSRINQTPNIDRIAREGLLFRNCFCVNSICAPSRASILTGLYGHRNGVRTNSDRLAEGVATFPRLLHEAGYATALVGKWHLQAQPEGFDYSCILPGQGAYFDPLMIVDGTKRKFAGYVSEVITDEAIAWLNRRDPKTPFCLLVHHKAPHANWEPGPRQAGLYQDPPIPEPDSFNDGWATRGQAIRSHRLLVGQPLWELHYSKRFGEIPSGVPPAEIRSWVFQRFIRDYLRCVASVDASVGRLLDYLKAEGLGQTTAVFYVSDQGFFLGEHGLYDMRFMYEESIRMPRVARVPGVTAAGREEPAIVLNVDLAPTLLELGGAPIPAGLHGRSALPLLRGQRPADWRKAMYYRFYEEAYGVGPHEGVRTERYKLIHFLYGDQAWELYDLEKDPHEMNNVHAAPGGGGVAAELRGEMERLRGELRADPL